jgi:hypothetical protein
MAGITTKATLETAVEGWLKRTDLSANYDLWEQVAEEMFKAPVRAPADPQVTGVRVAMTRATGTLSTSNAYISKPSDFLEPVGFRLTGNPQPLTWVAPDQIVQAGQSGIGTPKLWSVQDVVLFDIKPDSAYAYEFTYQNSATSIVGGATSAANALLTTYPMVYLSAVLHVAFDFNGDTENADRWLGRYKLFADSANRAFGEGLVSLGSIASYTDYSTP